MEFRYISVPSLPQNSYEKLYIIGDSVSAGIGGPTEQTWPMLLSKNHKIDVINRSVSGATVSSAISQIDERNCETEIMLLEIGGNDLLIPTPYHLFEKGLKQLLQKATGDNCMVIMLELPLLPWQSKYGIIQRRLAKQFDVVLIPRRIFVSVLSRKGASSDLAHLSPLGHEKMAEVMWSVLGNALIQRR